MALRYGEKFLEFWAEYPRKVSKILAEKSYNKVIKLGVEHEIIIAGVRKYSISVRGKDEQYIAHPSSWLNAGRWEDEYPRDDRSANKSRGEIMAELISELSKDGGVF